MRAKLAKMLHRIARDHTTGLPNRAYETKAKGRTIMIPQTVGPPLPFHYPDQVVLISGCTRAAYKQLKKQLRRSR